LGTGAPKGALASNQVIAIRLTALPANATAAVLNLTAAEPSGAGFVKVWPADAAGACSAANAPDVSNLNVTTGRTAPNLVTVALGGLSTVCASTTVPLHLITDLFGWFVQ
jgi:hypothetical protein